MKTDAEKQMGIAQAKACGYQKTINVPNACRTLVSSAETTSPSDIEGLVPVRGIPAL